MLSTGSRLGPYEILAPLGAGGMGEVYRARDTRLGREVAIKVLPSRVAEDPEQIRRFEREAQAASALNHANIVTIYDIGAVDSTTYIAMELVEGRNLRMILDAGPLPAKKALEITSQVAEGLARAHSAGIIHRDLKPENVMISRDGIAKILDFGLAKLGPACAESGGATLRMVAATEPGVILGTVGYMSPEQAEGRTVDFRSDQFAFGAILYELLTGRRAFARGNAVDTLAAILHEDPEPIEKLAPGIAEPLRWVVERCLAKEPAARYAATQDLALDLARLRASTSASGAISGAVSASSIRSSRSVSFWIAAGAAVIATTAALFFALRPVPPPPVYQQLTFRRGDVSRAGFAPDGQTVLYSASWEGKDQKIFLTRTNDRDSTPLSLPTASLFAISPSGKVAIGTGPRGTTLSETSLAAGAPRPLAENVRFADFQPGSEMLAISRKGRIEFPIGRVLYDPGPGGRVRDVRFSPRGDRIAFLEDRAGSTSVIDMDLAGRKKVLISGWSDVYGLAWNPPRNEVWFTAREGPKSGVLALHAVSLAGRQHLVASAPGILIVNDIASDGRVLLTRQDWSFSTMFGGVEGGPLRDLSWFGFSVAKALSPDGKTLLIDEDGVVYLRSTDGATPAVRLGDGTAQDLSPDGKWALVLPVSGPDHLIVLPTGPGESKALGTGGISCDAAIWFPDGQRILLQGEKKGERQRLYTLPVGGGRPRAVTPEGVELGPISPDGKLIAAEGPGEALFLYPADGGSGAPRQVSGIGPGERPVRWDATGRFLFLRKESKIFRLELSSGRKELWKEIVLSDPAGGDDLESFLLTSDGGSYAYSRLRSSSDLYLVTGLR